jgi:hypothetical protein
VFGGVAYVTSGAQWVAEGDDLIGNRGTLSGGVASGDSFTLLSLRGCLAADNYALVGSIASLSRGKFTEVLRSRFERNRASAYGGLVLESTSVNITSSQFVGNNASGRGAAVSVTTIPAQERLLYSDSFTTIISNSSFSDNFVNYSSRDEYQFFEGAALSFSDTPFALVDACNFSRNEALYGGAIFSVTSFVNITNSAFYDNKAKFGGGAVYWIVEKSSVFISAHTEERGNQARFGPFAATDTHHLSAGNATRVETSGQSIGAPFNVTLLDYYDQVVRYEDLEDANIVYVLTNESSTSSIQGKSFVQTKDGVAIFDKLIITYFPDQTLYLRFDLLGVPSLYYPVSFRSCVTGEVSEELSTKNVVCTVCSLGSYSLLPTAEVSRRVPYTAHVSYCACLNSIYLIYLVSIMVWCALYVACPLPLPLPLPCRNANRARTTWTARAGRCWTCTTASGGWARPATTCSSAR